MKAWIIFTALSIASPALAQSIDAAQKGCDRWYFWRDGGGAYHCTSDAPPGGSTIISSPPAPPSL